MIKIKEKSHKKVKKVKRGWFTQEGMRKKLLWSPLLCWHLMHAHYICAMCMCCFHMKIVSYFPMCSGHTSSQWSSFARKPGGNTCARTLVPHADEKLSFWSLLCFHSPLYMSLCASYNTYILRKDKYNKSLEKFHVEYEEEDESCDEDLELERKEHHTVRALFPSPLGSWHRCCRPGQQVQALEVGIPGQGTRIARGVFFR